MTAPHNVRKSAQRELELSCDWISGCVKLFAPGRSAPNQEFVTQNTVQQTDSNVPNLPPSDAMVETPPDETSSTSLSLSPSSKPENASEATFVGLPARYIQDETPS